MIGKSWWVKEAENRIILMRNAKLAIAFVVLNILDAALTLRAIANGGYEAFPIARYLLTQPAWVFWCFKIGMALILTMTLLIFANRYPRQVGRIFIVLIGVTAGVCIVNLVGLI